MVNVSRREVTIMVGSVINNILYEYWWVMQTNEVRLVFKMKNRIQKEILVVMLEKQNRTF